MVSHTQKLLQKSCLFIVLGFTCILITSFYIAYQATSGTTMRSQSRVLFIASQNNSNKNSSNGLHDNLKSSADLKSCFSPTSVTSNPDVVLFDDIFEAKEKPPVDRSIFFIETSCVRNGLAHLTARYCESCMKICTLTPKIALFSIFSRQACAIESTARWNPQRHIFVLFTSQVGFSEKLSSPIMKSLRIFPNLHFRRIYYREFAMGTPAQDFFTTDQIFQSKYLMETFSDVLRLVTLYRFGGIYLDLNVVVQKVVNFEVFFV